MKKKTKIILSILALFLVMAVGYAIFTENLKINGTATAQGSLDLTYECVDKNEEGGTGNCKVEDNTIITTSTLTKPTDRTIYYINITNTGTIPAILKTVDSSNNTSASDPNTAGDEIYLDKTTFLGAFNATCILAPDGETCTGPSNSFTGDSYLESQKYILHPGEKMLIGVIHEWIDSDGLFSKQPELPEDGASIEYNVTFGFQQVEA